MMNYKFAKVGPEEYKIVSVAPPLDLVGGVLSMEFDNPKKSAFRELEWLLSDAQQKQPFEGAVAINAHEIIVSHERVVFNEFEEYAGRESSCEVPLSEFVKLFEDWRAFLTGQKLQGSSGDGLR